MESDITIKRGDDNKKITTLVVNVTFSVLDCRRASVKGMLLLYVEIALL
jgi:hypothetical protein